MAGRSRGSKARGGDPGKNSDPLIDFAIITAVKIERDAVWKAFNLKHKHRVRKDSRVYWRARLPLKDGDHYEIVVAQPPDMAQVDAAILTNDLIHHWDPAALLMVGIAGAASDGGGEDDEALGDLVVGRDVYYYEGRPPSRRITSLDVRKRSVRKWER
jgi:nucleoside phosphorylase